MAYGMNPEKQWVRPSSSGTGGSTGPPTKNIERPGAGGARTGGITDRVMKAKPRRSLERYKGKKQVIKERFEQPEERTRRPTPAPRPMSAQGMPMLTPMPTQMGQFMQPQMQPQFMQQPMQQGMPTMVGAPTQPFMPQMMPQQTMMPQYNYPQYGGGGYNPMMPQYRRY